MVEVVEKSRAHWGLSARDEEFVHSPPECAERVATSFTCLQSMAARCIGSADRRQVGEERIADSTERAFRIVSHPPGGSDGRHRTAKRHARLTGYRDCSARRPKRNAKLRFVGASASNQCRYDPVISERERPTMRLSLAHFGDSPLGLASAPPVQPIDRCQRNDRPRDSVDRRRRARKSHETNDERPVAAADLAERNTDRGKRGVA